MAPEGLIRVVESKLVTAQKKCRLAGEDDKEGGQWGFAAHQRVMDGL